jgi:hypothetical protein
VWRSSTRRYACAKCGCKEVQLANPNEDEEDSAVLAVSGGKSKERVTSNDMFRLLTWQETNALTVLSVLAILAVIEIKNNTGINLIIALIFIAATIIINKLKSLTSLQRKNYTWIISSAYFVFAFVCYFISKSS